MTAPLDQAATAARPDERVLSLDAWDNDMLYRIRRNSRIVYVSVLSNDILPRDWRRNERSNILLHLRKVPRWEEEWTTLTVRKTPDGIESTPNEFVPHGLDLHRVDVSNAFFYNYVDLTEEVRVNMQRVSRVKCNGERMILKIAQFKHEIPYLQQEVSIYARLASSGFQGAPKLKGYVYEETKDRTIGFLMEEILGTPAGIENLEDCTETIRQLHACGIIHGDPNRHNFLITDSGAMVFDFEAAVVQEEADPTAAEKEIQSLELKLKDESGIGAPLGLGRLVDPPSPRMMED